MSSACVCHISTDTCYWCLWIIEKEKNEQLQQEIKQLKTDRTKAYHDGYKQGQFDERIRDMQK